MMPAICRHFKNTKGFTLIELVIVILIMGIISAVAIPSFDRSGIHTATWAATIATDIRYAQELALSRNPASLDPLKIEFSSDDNDYKITDPSGVFDEVERNLDDDGTSIDTDQTFSFNRFGEPVSFGTLQITSGEKTYTITVEEYTGRVTVSP